ncbi:alpha/beta-hydrolase [Auricularia subglabra TFB-10046 SS5]|nr:alpha/beta-hydrolase [Auricularia subglabra TFB-10046 SS5]
MATFSKRTTKQHDDVPAPRRIEVGFPDAVVEQMNALLKLATLPEHAPFPEAGWEHGIDLAWLKELKREWEDDFSWTDLKAEINKWPNYMVKFDEDDVDLHFVHVRSDHPDAVPLLLLHGWPGTFYDFHKVIEPLTRPTVPGSQPFHVVIPSLPGYFLSTYPARSGFTLVDTARIFHKLMTQVLGYERFMCQGGDWGYYILRAMVSMPETCHSVPLAHFNMWRAPESGAARWIPALAQAVPSFLDALPGWKATKDFVEETALSLFLTLGEMRSTKMRRNFAATGAGYVAIQSTKPLTVGYAIQSSPLSLLAYIGEKMNQWSDVGSPHFDTKDVIATVMLYYLSKSFATSTLIYHQSKTVREEMTYNRSAWKASKDCLLGYTLFPCDPGAGTRSTIKPVGNLAFWRERTYGGHFPALDNPGGLCDDLRAFVLLHSMG